jgi:tetratricopeptide (TPR) repeat protein
MTTGATSTSNMERNFSIEVKIPQPITITYSSANQTFSAKVLLSDRSTNAISPSEIKCGIRGESSHAEFALKIDQLARENIAIYSYSSKEILQIWMFEAVKAAAPLIKQAKVALEDAKLSHPSKTVDYYQKALKNFSTALKIQENQQGATTELSGIISELQKTVFLLNVKKEAPLYLLPSEVDEFNSAIDMYQDQDAEDIFSSLSNYLDTFEEPLASHLHLLKALVQEHDGNSIQAAQSYLHLARQQPNPYSSLIKAMELVKASSDPFAIPHFLEKLDRKWLLQTISVHPELKDWLQQKDAIRMEFENYLALLNHHSLKIQAPTCFICFDIEEADVANWIEHILVPDLDTIGIKPVFCLRDFGTGKELNPFQGLIRGADQVIVICTPHLKQKCDARKKAPTGVAQEIRLCIERYNDADKYETIFPLYLKGDRKLSCPSVFLEPILGTRFTSFDKSTESSVFSYYASAFELFGRMRGIQRETSRKMKDEFLDSVKQILTGKINRKELEEWLTSREVKITKALDLAQERVSKSTQMINLPLFPKNFTGREKELTEIHTACKQNSRVAVTGLGGIGKTALVLKYGDEYKSQYQFVYFIPVGTPELLTQGLLKLADDLSVPKKGTEEERLKMLKKTLNRLEKDYLLILDGVDKEEIFEKIEEYLPERGRNLLLSTRLPAISKKHNFENVNLDLLSITDSINYLLSTTGSFEANEANHLAQILGCFPLALTHAAEYICSRKFTIQRYLDQFNKFHLSLFEKEHLNLTKEEQTILTTWNISIDAIENEHPRSHVKEILACMAFLGQISIPLVFIKRWFDVNAPGSSELELTDCLGHLSDYSMINSSFSGSYNVHSLVQQVTLYQLSKVDIRKCILELMFALDSVYKNREEDEKAREEDVPSTPLVYVHAQIIDVLSSEFEFPKILIEMGMDRLIRHDKASPFLMMETLFGTDFASKTPNFLLTMAKLQASSEMYEPARRLLEEALETSRKTLPEDAAEILELKREQVNILLHLQELEQARKYLHEILAAKEKHSGEDISDLLVAIGDIYFLEGNFPEAGRYYLRFIDCKEASEIQKAAKFILLSLINRELAKNNEIALALVVVNLLKAKKLMHGITDTMKLINCLIPQGARSIHSPLTFDALDLFLQIYEENQKSQRHTAYSTSLLLSIKNSPPPVLIYFMLGLVCAELKNPLRAESYFDRAYSIIETYSKEDKPQFETIAIEQDFLKTLMNGYWECEKYEKAAKCYWMGLNFVEVEHGKYNSVTEDMLKNLRIICDKTGNLMQQREVLLRLIDYYTNTEITAGGKFYKDFEKKKEEIRKKLLAPLYVDLANVESKGENVQAAILHYEQATKLGEIDLEATSYPGLASCYYLTGQYKEAEIYWKKLVREIPSSSLCCQFGVFLMKLNRPEEAYTQFLNSIKLKLDRNTLCFGKPQKSYLDAFLSSDVDNYGEITIQASLLAYYYLIVLSDLKGDKTAKKAFIAQIKRASDKEESSPFLLRLERELSKLREK